MSRDIINQFIDAMAAAGCAPHNSADIIPDGEDHYFRLAEDRKDKRGGFNLAIESDGFAHGNFVNYKTGDKGSWHSGKAVGSAAERKESAARYKALEAARNEAVAARHAEKAIEARNVWDAADLAIEHPYLAAKGIGAHGARVEGDDLILRGMSIDGEIYTYQRISADGSKLYLSGARKKGCFYPMLSQGVELSVILVCEGFATAASIREAVWLPVLAAFDAPNIDPVVKDVRKKYPDAKIVICADNDAQGERNTGLDMARQAATKYGAAVVWPEFGDNSDYSDFNDAHKIFGLDYVRDTILAAVEASAPKGIAIVPPSTADMHTLGGDIIGNLSPEFERDKLNKILLWKKLPSNISDGKLETNNLHNILAYLRHKDKYVGLFRYDRFAGRMILHRQPFWWPTSETFKVREMIDSDVSYICASMEQDGLGPSTAKVYEAVGVVARENWIDPPLNYFNALVWDGVPRLQEWLIKYLGARGEREYLAAVGTAFCVAIVARQFVPGCKAENMLVLEGPQGLLKSTALRALADVGCGADQESYFCDTLSFDQLKDKDSVLKMQGKTIIEIPDLAGLGNREIEEVKQRMSIQVDEIRVPYGREMAKFPRRFVWAGSTNESHWLKDQTGNRRFWPVECGKINIKGLVQDREQLIAEAVSLYKSNAQWWIGRENPVWAKVEEVQRERLLDDVWFLPVEKYVVGMNFVTVTEILQHLKIDIKDQKNQHQKQVIGILKQIGFVSEIKRYSGKLTRGWKRINAEPSLEDYEEISF